MAKIIAAIPKQTKAAMLKALGTTPAGKAELTEQLFDLLPKPSYYPVILDRVIVNGKTAVVDQAKIAETVKYLNGLYKKTKDIHLIFTSIVPLSQEVITTVNNKKVRTRTLGMITPYNWKARFFDVAFTGWNQLTEDQQRKTRTRFDRGIVAFGEQYKLRYIKAEPVVAETPAKK